MKCNDCNKEMKEVKGNEDILSRFVCPDCGLLYEITSIDGEEIEYYTADVIQDWEAEANDLKRKADMEARE